MSEHDIHISSQDQRVTRCGLLVTVDVVTENVVRSFETHPRESARATCSGCRGSVPWDNDDLACIVTPSDTKRELIAIERKIASGLSITGSDEEVRAVLRRHYGSAPEDDDYQKWVELLAAHNWDLQWAKLHPEEKVNFDELVDV